MIHIFSIICLFLFRVSRSTHDLWTSLEKNWSHFFWLTGETPQTLGVIVHKIRDKYIHLFHEFSRSKLDLRNQVCIILNMSKKATNFYAEICVFILSFIFLKFRFFSPSSG